MDTEILLFIDYLSVEKKYSPHTITAYRHDLEQFSQFAAQKFGNLSIASINHLHIRAWLASLLADEVKAVSVNRKISSLKSFFKHLKRMGKTTANPMVKVQSPKKPKLLPVFVEKGKMEVLTDTILPEEGTE